MAIAVPYLTENSLINFPLSDNQGVPDALKRFIVDAEINFFLPFYCTPTITSVSIDIFNHIAITLGSKESQDTFATLTAFSQSYSSGNPHWAVCRSRGDVGASSSGQEYLSPTLSVTVNTEVIPEILDWAESTEWTWSGELLFDPHVLSYEPLRFETLILDDPNGLGAPVVISPTSYRQIWFRGGHNLSIVPEGEDGLLFSAGPGLGMGRTPCEDCDDHGTVANSKVTGPKLHGHVKLVGDGCITVDPHPTDSNKLIIKDTCTACCQCSQYAEKVETLRNLAISLRGVGDSLKDNIQKLNRSIEKFNQVGGGSSDCDPEMWEITLSASGSNPSKSGKAKPRLYANVSIINMTCYTGIVSMQPEKQVGEFSVTDGKTVDGTTQWYLSRGGTDEDDLTGTGLPNQLRVKPGEALKVMRTFEFDDTSIEPYPANPGFNKIVKARGIIDCGGRRINFDKQLRKGSA